MASPAPERLLTTEEVAEYLGVTPTRLYAWRAGGFPCPPAIRVGRTLRFRRTDLEAWVTQQAQAARPDGGAA